MTKIIQTMRYEIEYNKTLYNILSEIQYHVWRIRNKSTTMAYDWQQFSFSYNERFGSYPSEKDILGKGKTADIYQNVKELGKYVASSTVDVANQEAVKKFEEKLNDIINGRTSLPIYKRNRSFPIRASQIRNLTKIKANRYSVKLSLLSIEGSKKYQLPTQFDAILKSGRGSNVILDRITNGTYKLRDSKIDKKKNKFYLLIAYQQEVNHEIKLNKDNIMGIDMGIVNPVYIAFNNSPKRFYINGDEISHFRKGIESRRKQLLRQAKYCGKGRIGHGRKTRIKPIEKLTNRVENFKNTTNHKYSKYIIDLAIKNNCGIIQMEDLSGVSDGERKSTFLGNWTYYDLQEKIKYKAEKAGIEVKMIDPKHTSQRCSNCGYISKENRNAKKNQAKFECVHCGYRENADYNAAKNIATPNIEKIIKDQLERQEKEINHAKKYLAS